MNLFLSCGITDNRGCEAKFHVVDLAGMGHPDAEPKLIGRNIHVMLTPLPVNKRKPKFINDNGPDMDEEPHESESDSDDESDS